LSKKDEKLDYLKSESVKSLNESGTSESIFKEKTHKLERHIKKLARKMQELQDELMQKTVQFESEKNDIINQGNKAIENVKRDH